MDIFVLPSLSEGLSMALLEAMAAGLPVVATDVGGNPELVVDGTTGYLVPPKRSEDLADRLILLLRNKSQAQWFGQNGRMRVREHFSLEQMINKYQDLYTQCLGTVPRTL
jgi:glycosyltransferase involved in cell wall biosynthesis